MTLEDGYVGRFAPSPSGPLHLGSLTTAVASYLDAKQHSGQWRLRMDDLDTPRNQPGASDAILRCLEQHHLHWTGEVMYQSSRLAHYQQAAEQLQADKLTFYCDCSRRMLTAGEPYPGTCRTRTTRPATDTQFALRLRTRGLAAAFEDLVAGAQDHSLESLGGDFILWRRDDQPSYQLATAVDDGSTGITHIVRGNDLLADTTRQLLLVALLGGTPAHYAHLPVVVDDKGVKLSKRTGAQPVDPTKPAQNLRLVLKLLGMAPPTDLTSASPQELLSWATVEWQRPGAGEPNWQVSGP